MNLTVYCDLLCSLLVIKSLWFFSATSLSSRSIVIRCSATFLKSPSSPSAMVSAHKVTVCEVGGGRSTFQKTCIRLSGLHTQTVTGLDPRLSCRIPGNEANTASHTYRVASFPGCSRLQFLIAYCMQKCLGERVTCVTSGRREGRREGGGA